ncbi:MAG: DNA primase [Oscillospiraceae bacterium]|nr:DNA primase [Oscillospiraceae bacterium]
MAFPESFIEELVERSNIVDVVSSYVQLTRKGSNMFGLCPFHNEKTGSFSVSESKQLYYCFGCGKGGGVINFIMEIENLSYPDAVRLLADRAGMVVPEESGDEAPKRRKRLLELNKDAARFFHSMLSAPEGALAAEYAAKRQLTPKTIRNFGLGAAPDSWDALIRAMTEKGYTKRELLDAGLVSSGKNGRIYDKFRNRLMFPVIDVRGDVIAFGGRSLDGSEPKYLNSPETAIFSKRRSLYGINLAKNTKRGSILLVEGNIDVVTLHQAGIDNAVATMGTSLTTEQTRLISRYAKEIIICYDNDPAGLKATDRAISILKNSEFSVKVLHLPDRVVEGKKVKIDADDYIKLYGAPAFEKLMRLSENHIEYELAVLRGGADLESDDGRVEYLKKAGELIAKLSSPVEREVYAGRAAETAGVSREAMLAEIERARKRLAAAARKKIEKEASRPAGAMQPADRSMRYTDVRSAAAEEGVVRLLMLDPSLISKCDLKGEEFTSPFLGSVYSIIVNRAKELKSVDPAAIIPLLGPEEAQELTRISQKPQTAADAPQTLKQYIDVIRTQRLAQSDDLMAARNKFLENKAYESREG